MTNLVNTAPLKLGYLVPEFPSQTHAFFWREVLALRALGTNVCLISTRRALPGACLHSFAAAATAETHYLFPPSWARAVWLLISRPRRALKALAYVAGLVETPLGKRLAAGAFLVPAAEMCAHAQLQGISHIHVHSCANAAHVAAICRLLGGPSYSLTLHGDLSVYGSDHAMKTKDAAFVACVTRPLQQQLCNATGLPLERAPVLWMGVDTARFCNVGARASVAGQLRILTVARLNPTKGLRYSLQALRTALDRGVKASYVIAGEGPDRNGIEQEVKRLALEQHVRLVGTQSEDQVLGLLQQSDVLVLPSIGAGEAAPVSVMEAMACGLPVICSIIGGTKDMIADEVNGFLVEQMDSDTMAERLMTLSGDLPLRQRMGQAARRRAEASFDCGMLASRMLALLNDARSSGGAQGASIKNG